MFVLFIVLCVYAFVLSILLYFYAHTRQPIGEGEQEAGTLQLPRIKCPLQSLLGAGDDQRDGRAVKALRDWHRRKADKRDTRWEASIIMMHLERAEAA